MASSLLPFGIDVPELDVRIQLDEVKEEAMRTVCRIGLDTAKNVFQVHALDASGCTVVTRRLRRSQVLAWFHAGTLRAAHASLQQMPSVAERADRT